MVPLSARNAAVLTLVALEGHVERSDLAAMLWPDKLPNAAGNALRQVLHKLGDAAGQHLTQGVADLALAAGVSHDMGDPGAALRNDPTLIGKRLFERDDLASWPALADAVDAAVGRWQARLTDAALALVDTWDRADRAGDALQIALRLVAAEPLDERCTRAAMRMHWRCGEAGRAQALYARFEQALAEDIDAEPSAETRQLLQHIRSTSASPHADTPRPPALHHPPLTFGREITIRRAEQLWHHEGAVLLTGPAGIGKSRLFDDLVRRWGVAVVARPSAQASAVSYSGLRLLADALAAHGSAIGAAPEPLLDRLHAGERGEAPPTAPMLAQALQHCIERLHGSGVTAIAIDDIHHIDNESLEVFLLLWPQTCGPVRWLLASRDTPLPDTLHRWRERRGSADWPQIALAPLGASALSDWLALVGVPAADLAAWAASLLAHTGGHPWSVMQVLREHHLQGAWAGAPPGRWPMPQQTLARLARELDHGDEATRRLAYVLAIADTDFDAPVAADVLGCRSIDLVTPWRRLESMGLLLHGRIAHELYRHALRDTVPAALAPVLHLGVAEALQQVGAPAARRAPHFEAAGDRARAAADYQAAALDAQRCGLHGKALTLHRKAAALWGEAGDLARAFDACHDACGMTVVVDGANEAMAEVRQLLALASDERQRCLAACQMSYVLAHLYDERAIGFAEQAIALARTAGDPALLAQARLREGSARFVTGDWANAVATLRPLVAGDALSAADMLDAQDVLVSALAAGGQRQHAVDQLQHGLAAALLRDDPARAAALCNSLGTHLGYLCRPREAMAALQQSVAHSRRAQGDGGALCVDEASIAGHLADLGEFAAALSQGEAALAAMHRGHYLVPAMNTEHLLANVYATLGRLDLAGKQLREVPAEAPLWMRALRAMAKARVTGLQGKPALALAQQAFAMLEDSGAAGNPFVRWRMQLDVARWSPPETTVDLAQTCRQWARQHEYLALERMAACLQMEGLLKQEAFAEAASVADTLMASMGAEPDVVGCYLPDLWHAVACAWRKMDRGHDVDTVFLQARAWIDHVIAHHLPAGFDGPFLERNAANAFFVERRPR